jgi:molybdopterin-guanine dinucleotide biosynthesis protein A
MISNNRSASDNPQHCSSVLRKARLKSFADFPIINRKWDAMRAAIILAGGKGSRFGGSKHLRQLQGKALALHVVERASTVVEEVLVVLRHDDNPEFYRDILPGNVKLVMDTAQSETPLVGIMTGARASTAEYSAFLSCDLVFLNPEALRYLFHQAEGVDAAIPEWPDGLLEPLHAVYRTRGAADAAEAALEAHEYRTIAVARRLKNVKRVPVDEIKPFDPDLLTFFNANAEEDLMKAERILAQKTR